MTEPAGAEAGAGLAEMAARIIYDMAHRERPLTRCDADQMGLCIENAAALRQPSPEEGVREALAGVVLFDDVKLEDVVGDDGLDRILAALPQQRAGEWRSIESAPKETLVVLAYPDVAGEIVVGTGLIYRDGSTDYGRKPVGWLPLPSPPESPQRPVAEVTEPTDAEVLAAAWAWRVGKDRETDGSDDRYFLNNWRSLPGLKSYVDAEVAKRPVAEVTGAGA